MLALAGLPLGLRFRFVDVSAGVPAAAVGEVIAGAFDDPDLLRRFAAGLAVATYEFENVPVAAARTVAERVPVLPPPAALEVAQDRLVEKSFFARLGIPTSPFEPVGSADGLAAAARRIGLPAVLKTRRLGYDGKGQRVLRSQADLAGAWEAMGGMPLLLERFVDFDRELSVLAVRGRTGETAVYPLVENRHREGILRLTLAPAPGLPPLLQSAAERHAAAALAALDYVGVLAIELFARGGELLANEMAPRVHNSYHWTIEGARTSQFENHLRAVLGLPPGSTALTGHHAMLNLIGSTPDPAAVLAVPGAHLHLYGKAPRPGRKLGHVTVTADSPAERDALLARLSTVIDTAGSHDRPPAR
jgi:5-(carboxyamino)imidazole ribonucleotide synthase